MGHPRSRALLVGLGAAVGAFGAAAMMSAATAATARADDFTEIINAVEGDLSTGQTAFTDALADFGSSSEVPLGLTYFFDGVDDDFWGAPSNLEVGTVEALTGAPITSNFSVGLPEPTSLSDAVTIAEAQFSAGEVEFTDAATALSSGDYADAALDNDLGSLLAFDVPAQELFIGAVEALGL
jgi:hypothetical protein